MSGKITLRGEGTPSATPIFGPMLTKNPLHEKFLATPLMQNIIYFDEFQESHY
jgi:hypothetical protein